MKKEKEIIKKYKLFRKGKIILKRKEQFMNFQIKEKLILWISKRQRIFFSMPAVDEER